MNNILLNLSRTVRGLTPEFDYWQYWRNVADSDVIRFLKLFTEVDAVKISRFSACSGSELNEAKILLADEATAMLHGKDCLAQIHKSAESVFSGGAQNAILDHSIYEALPNITAASKEVVYCEDGDTAGPGVDIAVALVLCHLASTRSEARRLVKSGGVKVNGIKIEDSKYRIRRRDFDYEGRVILSAGKKRHMVFVVPLKFWPKTQ
jgi:tyrosyl-tRNA synthetase